MNRFYAFGLAEKVTLADIAAGGHDGRQLVRRLDAFRDDGHAEGVAQGNDRAENSAALRAVGVAHERLVDLEDVGRKLVQVRQRRVTSAEVVDGNLDTEL